MEQSSPQQQAEDQQEILDNWCKELLAKFEISGTPLDSAAILGLAGRAAHGIVRPAAPLTTFIAGFAAGLAAGSGQASDELALRSAIETAREAVAARNG
ncbi:DUF6457 domain-containing protein [Psychromicrobium lacuslunae]|uniref:Molybdopterin-guanine dinucleotide biosynthesis protein n=1 Tax=Psychromicrobium lacuslunae TaxID=1618207 RepID=A0A0D4C2N9_9MICC|nr:DUF6457 domain-containing protein [Psychromicrobium lacuslunae]AJT42650.1 molybdopterin-guanine dinucleotide biosynthesis protein [Psychromicrobium lacuslunae]